MKKILIGVAVVTVVLIGAVKYFTDPSPRVFDYSGEPNSDQFVQDNLLATLYHEIGHAMIDQLELPLFGQEEDAADVASVFLIDALYEEEAAIEITYAAADMFLALAEETGEPYWAGTHGPDLQRYYNLACLFAGADIEARAHIGEDLGVPEDRMSWCEAEFDAAKASWGAAFEGLAKNAPAQSIAYDGGTETLTEKLIMEEIGSLNEDFAFPNKLTVAVEECGEPNAFYNPDEVRVVMCTENAEWLRYLPLPE